MKEFGKSASMKEFRAPKELIRLALHNKRPFPREPQEYMGLPEILILTRKTTGLSRESLANYLHISSKTVERAEAAGARISLQVDTLEKVKDLAIVCRLKEAERILNVMLRKQRNMPQRGPKKRTGPWWQDEKSS